MIRLLRTLDVDAHPEAGRRLHVASGSSLVLCGRWAYVAIDDELHVGAFERAALHRPGRLVRVLPGELPLEHRERKAAKPDLESLFELGDLLVGVPSGSTPGRVTGFTAQLAADGELVQKASPVDWAPLLRSGNVDGGHEWNGRIMDEYGDRIF